MAVQSGVQLSFLDDPKADLPLRRKVKRYDAEWTITVEWWESSQRLHLEVTERTGGMSGCMEPGDTVNDALARADSYIERSGEAHEWYLKRAVERGDVERFEHRGYELKIFKFAEGWYKCLASEPNASYPFSHWWTWIERPGYGREALIAQAHANIDSHLDVEGVADKAEWDAACKAGAIGIRHYDKYWHAA